MNGKKRLTVDLDDETYMQFKLLAVMRRTKMTEIMRELIKKELEADPKSSAS
jgi:hypothetical protein